MLDTPSEFMDLVKQGPTRTSFKCRLQDEARPPESQRHDANSATSSALAALSKCGANGTADGAGGGTTEVLGGGKGGKESWP